MQQTSLLGAPTQLRAPGLVADYCEQFLPAKLASAAFEEILTTTTWEQSKLKVYGQWHLSPRLVQFFGEPHLRKQYSGQVHVPQAWTDLLQELRRKVQAHSDTQFNCVLANYYRDGQDAVGWHADDESQLGPQPVIASLTLGGVRPFHLKHQNDRSIKPIKIDLAHGSLLLMRPPTQQFWHHQIPRTARHNQPRINLTFRNIIR